eukprot:6210446-Pleurochrysis_carterae.AAC.1
MTHTHSCMNTRTLSMNHSLTHASTSRPTPAVSASQPQMLKLALAFAHPLLERTSTLHARRLRDRPEAVFKAEMMKRMVR